MPDFENINKYVILVMTNYYFSFSNNNGHTT